MARKIAKSIDDFPNGVADSVPLGCVLEDDVIVVAYGEGGTFNEYGLSCISPDLQVFIVGVGEESVKVYAEDVGAALLWLRDHYCGPYDISIEPANVFVGTFDEEEEEKA